VKKVEEVFSIMGGTNNARVYTPKEMPIEIGVVTNPIDSEEKMVYIVDKEDGDTILIPLEYIGLIIHTLITLHVSESGDDQEGVPHYGH
jgi:hypothetical protein